MGSFLVFVQVIDGQFLGLGFLKEKDYNINSKGITMMFAYKMKRGGRE
jgi:hypothetical protein